MKTSETRSRQMPKGNDSPPTGPHWLIAYLSYSVDELYVWDKTAGLLVKGAIHRLISLSGGGAKGPGAGI